MQQEENDRYARVLLYLNKELERTKLEFDQVKEEYDRTDDEDERSDCYECLLFAESDYRDALSMRDKILAID